MHRKLRLAVRKFTILLCVHTWENPCGVFFISAVTLLPLDVEKILNIDHDNYKFQVVSDGVDFDPIRRQRVNMTSQGTPVSACS